MTSRLARWPLSRTRSHGQQESRPTGFFKLTSLPNELLFALLDVMDDTSLHIMVAVSKRFYHLATQTLLSRYFISLALDSVTLASSDALRAFRIAMTLYSGAFKRLEFFPTSMSSLSKDMRRLDALIRRFGRCSVRIPEILLRFTKNALGYSVGWNQGQLTRRLLTTICGDSSGALFIANKGLFTCKPKSMVGWNPFVRDQYTKVEMHDGSRQWVPTILSILTIDVTCPVCTALSPDKPWTMVVLNKEEVLTLLLSIQLSAREWAAILAAVSLPKLVEVGIWAETISCYMSTAFLNRHPTVTVLKYMSPIAEPLPPTAHPLTLPHLHHLTALSHYIVHVFSGRDSGAAFPQLEHVELFPDFMFPDALRLLSVHSNTTLESLTFWLLTDLEPAAWPVFPLIESVTLNKCDVASASLPTLLAHAFPALRQLGVNHSFGKPYATAPRIVSPQKDPFRQAKKALVRKISRANPNVHVYVIDNWFFPPP
ncbi:hypothetical protein DFH06DRAFT_1221806 [Mycena polygramma]|nr:hypothetical protein DFH06DRAFT_1221806 [Mycena polygramma]